MTREQTIGALEAGHTVTDIGQLSREAKTAIRRYVRLGVIETLTSYAFPIPKTAYRMVAS